MKISLDISFCKIGYLYLSVTQRFSEIPPKTYPLSLQIYSVNAVFERNSRGSSHDLHDLLQTNQPIDHLIIFRDQVQPIHLTYRYRFSLHSNLYIRCSNFLLKCGGTYAFQIEDEFSNRIEILLCSKKDEIIK